MDRRSSKASQASRSSRASIRKTSLSNPEARDSSKAQPARSSILSLPNKKRLAASQGGITLIYMKLDGTQEKRSIKTPDSYLTLQQRFAERFPRVKSLLVVELEDGKTLNPMEVKNLKDGTSVVFREFQPPEREPNSLSDFKPVFFEEMYLESLHQRGSIYEVVGTGRRLPGSSEGRGSLVKPIAQNRRTSTCSNTSNRSKRVSTS